MDGVLLQQALKFVQEAGDTIEMEVEFDVTGRSCESHVTSVRSCGVMLWRVVEQSCDDYVLVM